MYKYSVPSNQGSYTFEQRPAAPRSLEDVLFDETFPLELRQNSPPLTDFLMRNLELIVTRHLNRLRDGAGEPPESNIRYFGVVKDILSLSPANMSLAEQYIRNLSEIATLIESNTNDAAIPWICELIDLILGIAEPMLVDAFFRSDALKRAMWKKIEVEAVTECLGKIIAPHRANATTEAFEEVTPRSELQLKLLQEVVNGLVTESDLERKAGLARTITSVVKRGFYIANQKKILELLFGNPETSLKIVEIAFTNYGEAMHLLILSLLEFQKFVRGSQDLEQQFTFVANSGLIEACEAKLAVILAGLKGDNADESSLTTRPLGLHRINLVDLIQNIIRLRNTKFEVSLCQSGVINQLLTLMSSFNRSDILNYKIYEILSNLLQSSSNDVIDALLGEKINLLNFIVEQMNDFTTKMKDPRKDKDSIIRKCYIGHLISLAVAIQRLQEIDQYIHTQLEKHENWAPFYNQIIVEELRREKTPLCGVDVEALKAQRGSYSVVNISGGPPMQPDSNRPQHMTPPPKQIVISNPMSQSPPPLAKDPLGELIMTAKTLFTPPKAPETPPDKQKLLKSEEEQEFKTEVTPVKQSQSQEKETESKEGFETPPRPLGGRPKLLVKHKPTSSKAIDSEVKERPPVLATPEDEDVGSVPYKFEPNQNPNVLFTDDRVRVVYPMDFYLAQNPQESNVRIIGYSQPQVKYGMSSGDREKPVPAKYAQFQFAPIRIFRDEGDYAPLSGLRRNSGTEGNFMSPFPSSTIQTNATRFQRSYSHTPYPYNQSRTFEFK